MEHSDNDKKYSLKEIIEIFMPYFDKYIKPNIKQLTLAVLSIIIINLLYLTIPFFQKHFVDDGLIGKNFEYVIKILIALFLSKGLIDVILPLWEYIYSFLVNKLCYNIEKDLYKHILNLPVSYFDNHRSGEILRRVWDYSSIINIINLVVFDFLNNISIIILSILAGLFINPIIVLITIFFIPISLINNYYQGKISGKNEEARFEIDKTLGSEQAEAVFGIRSIKALGFESKAYRRFLLMRLKYRQIEFKFKRKLTGLNAINTLFNNLEEFLTMLIAGIFVIKGIMTIGDWMAYYLIFARISVPLKQLIAINVKLQTNIVVLKRLNSILKEKEEEHTNNKNIIIKKGTLSFKNVNFGYSQKKLILKNINFKVEKGQSLALVGRSGVGKSTIANLILSFYLPTKGKILIDDVDIIDYNVRSMRNTCITSPCNPLFSFVYSIFNNKITKFFEFCYITIEQRIHESKIFMP